jgi:hypothetical protein
MKTEEKELDYVDAMGEVTVTLKITVSLDESELADLMGCDVEDLINQDEDEVKKKLEEYAEYNWQDYHQHSEIDGLDTDLSIEAIYVEDEEEETN